LRDRYPSGPSWPSSSRSREDPSGVSRTAVLLVVTRAAGVEVPRAACITPCRAFDSSDLRQAEVDHRKTLPHQSGITGRASKDRGPTQRSERSALMAICGGARAHVHVLPGNQTPRSCNSPDVSSGKPASATQSDHRASGTQASRSLALGSNGSEHVQGRVSVLTLMRAQHTYRQAPAARPARCRGPCTPYPPLATRRTPTPRARSACPRKDAAHPWRGTCTRSGC